MAFTSNTGVAAAVCKYTLSPDCMRETASAEVPIFIAKNILIFYSANFDFPSLIKKDFNHFLGETILAMPSFRIH
jgi:hypothetical protein